MSAERTGREAASAAFKASCFLELRRCGHRAPVFCSLARAVLQGFLERLPVYLERPPLRCFGQITFEVEKVSGLILRV